MPDAAGWPTAAEVEAKVDLASGGAFTPEMRFGASSVLASVVAEFEGAPGIDGSGGTGRSFTPRTEMRVFDGSGYRELVVPDIVPDTPFSVLVWGAAALNVTLKSSYSSQGYNTLVLGGYGYGFGYGGGYSGYGSVFPLGSQNIIVTATWGYAATVPADVYEAVLCEATSRVLVQSFVPLTGVGELVQLEDFQLNTSSGISVWGQSSPIAVMHNVYEAAVKRYRVSGNSGLKRLAASRRMS